MILSGAVVVAARRAGETATIEYGFACAEAFGAPVRGRLVADAALSRLCQLPAPFLPRAAAAGGPRAAAMMTAALAGEARRLAALMAARAARSAAAFAMEEAAEDEPGPGDLVVSALDLSERDLGPQIAAARALALRTGGALLAPATRPGRAGAVIVVAEGPGDRAVALGRAFAAHARAPLVVFAPAAAAPGLAARLAGQARVAPAPALIDAAAAGVGAVRLIVCAPAALPRLAAVGDEAPLRRFRAGLLIPGGAEAA